MHHLLRERGGHGPLRLRTHVFVLRMWPQTQENGQRLLPHLQEDNQRYHQDLPQHVGRCWTGGVTLSPSAQDVIKAM